MSHTQGPWELVELDAPLDDWTGASYIIRQPEHAPGGVAVIIGGAGGRDDALLVLAAPELLEALSGMIGLIALMVGRSDIPSQAKEAAINSHRWVAAHAAIAKTTGGAV